MHTIDPAANERGPKTGYAKTGHEKEAVRQGETTQKHRVSRVLVFSTLGAAVALVLIAAWFTG